MNTVMNQSKSDWNFLISWAIMSISGRTLFDVVGCIFKSQNMRHHVICSVPTCSAIWCLQCNISFYYSIFSITICVTPNKYITGKSLFRFHWGAVDLNVKWRKISSLFSWSLNNTVGIKTTASEWTGSDLEVSTHDLIETLPWYLCQRTGENYIKSVRLTCALAKIQHPKYICRVLLLHRPVWLENLKWKSYCTMFDFQVSSHVACTCSHMSIRRFRLCWSSGNAKFTNFLSLRSSHSSAGRCCPAIAW